MEWIEIPAHRELRVNRGEIVCDFEAFSAQGYDVPPVSCVAYRLRRKRDGKMFKFSPYYRVTEDAPEFMLEEA